MYEQEEENKYPDDPFYQMYLDCTDPLRIAENRRKNGIKEMQESKKLDTGII